MLLTIKFHQSQHTEAYICLSPKKKILEKKVKTSPAVRGCTPKSICYTSQGVNKYFHGFQHNRNKDMLTPKSLKKKAGPTIV